MKLLKVSACFYSNCQLSGCLQLNRSISAVNQLWGCLPQQPLQARSHSKTMSMPALLVEDHITLAPLEFTQQWAKADLVVEVACKHPGQSYHHLRVEGICQMDMARTIRLINHQCLSKIQILEEMSLLNLYCIHLKLGRIKATCLWIKAAREELLLIFSHKLLCTRELSMPVQCLEVALLQGMNR